MVHTEGMQRHISVYLDDDILEHFKKMARKQNRSASGQLRHLIDKWLAENTPTSTKR